jgi:SAM-dependent methyltransferase
MNHASTTTVSVAAVSVAAASANAVPAVELYDAALGSRRRLHLVAQDGRRLPFPLARWTAAADRVDHLLLARCEGRVLDVGCGPGRLAAALADAGHQVLGVDIAGAAVASTEASGAPALHRSVFEPLPGEGEWGTVLLADGNLGIGADPDALLARARELLCPGGLLLVEPEPADVDELVHLRLRTADGEQTSSGFDWALVGPGAARRRAVAAGYDVEDQWRLGGRTFLALRA